MSASFETYLDTSLTVSRPRLSPSEENVIQNKLKIIEAILRGKMGTSRQRGYFTRIFNEFKDEIPTLTLVKVEESLNRIRR